MFERFTERARQVVVLAQEEARTHDHAFVELEHIVMGLIREEEGLAAQILRQLGIVAPNMDLMERWAFEPRAQIPFTPRAKKVLELALREALSLGHNYIGTEHILLGLLREQEDLSDKFCGSPLDDVRIAVLNALRGTGRKPKATEPSPSRDVLLRQFIAAARAALDAAEALL